MQIATFLPPSLMYFSFICCKEEKAVLWLNMWWDAPKSVAIADVGVDVDVESARSNGNSMEAVHWFESGS